MDCVDGYACILLIGLVVPFDGYCCINRLSMVELYCGYGCVSLMCAFVF